MSHTLRINDIEVANPFKARYANFTPYVAASLIFLAITIPCTRLADWALARQRARTRGTAIA